MADPRIWILPPEVAERIAAGEVVERPSSVVKELVENALDAGARRITVETEAGGKALIRATDDGQGMTPEEVRLALQPHATSKLRTADDLFNIRTLGFRGEALPSIAAVSEMEILTRTPDATEGARIVVEGGAVRAQEPAAAQIGTTVTVRRLFHNVPVREKFLRSDMAEATQITEWLQRLALSRPEVSFRLVHDSREALLSPGSQDPLNAIVAILGRAVARDLLRLGVRGQGLGVGDGVAERGEERGERAESPVPNADPLTPNAQRPTPILVSGFVGRPTLTRANRNLQHFYVNGRAVRSPIFYRSLDDAFRSTMPHGRNPVALVMIEVPPGTVDVNVHPAKTEIRFQDEPAVHAAIYRAVQAALRADAATQMPTSLPAEAPWIPDEPPPSLRVAEPGSSPPGYGEVNPFAEQAMGGPSPLESYRREWRPPAHHHEPGPRRSLDEWASGGQQSTAGGQQSGDAVPGYGPSGTAIGELRLLGQAQDLFILAEGGGRLWVIDQHVAHERVLFDRMTAPRSVGEPAEPLLIPAAVDVDQAGALALEEHRELLAELGFGIEPFGPGRYQLRSVPRSLLGQDYETVLRDLADELAERTHGGQTHLRKEEVAAAAAGRSCKKAVKAGHHLSPAEMEQLLADLRATRNPYTCPHGRPVFLTFEPEEIAQLFGGRTCEGSGSDA